MAVALLAGLGYCLVALSLGSPLSDFLQTTSTRGNRVAGVLGGYRANWFAYQNKCHENKTLRSPWQLSTIAEGAFMTQYDPCWFTRLTAQLIRCIPCPRLTFLKILHFTFRHVVVLECVGTLISCRGSAFPVGHVKPYREGFRRYSSQDVGSDYVNRGFHCFDSLTNQLSKS